MPTNVPTPALDQLYKMLSSDLDLDNGGLTWMVDQIDWKRRCLLSEYLISAVGGVRASLNHAAFCLDEFKKSITAEAIWVQQQWKEVDTLAQTNELQLDVGDARLAAVTNRTGLAADRRVRLDIYPDMCLTYLVQALDRMAAVVAISISTVTKALQVDWKDITKAAKAGAQKGHDLRRQGDAGTRLQQQVYDVIVTGPSSCGPTDWLEWLLRARDTTAHRAPKISWHVLTYEKGKPHSIVRPFHAQPGWGEVEAMMSATPAKGSHHLPILLEDVPESTLAGLLNSTCQLVDLVIAEVVKVVEAREIDPTVIVQNGSQWPEPFSVPTLNYPGNGHPPKVKDGGIHLHPDSMRHMEAARMSDKWAAAWRE